MLVVLDSHTLIWALSDCPQLSDRARRLFFDSTSRMCVPAMALAEIAHLYNRGRIEVSLSDVVQFIDSVRNAYIAPIDLAIVNLMPPALEMHDAIIVATAIRERELADEDCVLLTCDNAIMESGLVDVVW